MIFLASGVQCYESLSDARIYSSNNFSVVRNGEFRTPVARISKHCTGRVSWRNTPLWDIVLTDNPVVIAWGDRRDFDFDSSQKDIEV